MLSLLLIRSQCTDWTKRNINWECLYFVVQFSYICHIKITNPYKSTHSHYVDSSFRFFIKSILSFIFNEDNLYLLQH